MMLQRLFTKKLEAENFHRAEHDLIWIFTQGIRAEHPPCPSSGTIPVRKKQKKQDSSFSEFPPVRRLLDRLHATSPGTNSASAARAAGQRLPCANVQDRVRVDRSHSLGRAPGGGKKHGNLTLLELLPPHFFFFFFGRNRWEGLQDRRS